MSCVCFDRVMRSEEESNGLRQFINGLAERKDPSPVMIETTYAQLADIRSDSLVFATPSRFELVEEVA